jgi:hypothetical protein
VTRDWWWPWWISTGFDVLLALAATAVVLRARRRPLRAGAAVVASVALLAAILAPVVMRHPRHAPSMQIPMQEEMSR